MTAHLVPAADLETASTDDQLTTRAIAHVREGDPSALHFLYVRYADDLRAYLAGIVHDRFAAESIVQDVFANLMAAVEESEDRRFPLGTSLLRMATSRARELPPQLLVHGA